MGHHAERGVVRETSPAAAFEVVQADFALHLLVVALHSPAQPGQAHQPLHRGVLWKRGQVVLRRACLPARPLNQQPYLLAWRGSLDVTLSRMDARGRKPGGLLASTALAPADGVELLLGHLESQLLNGPGPQALGHIAGARASILSSHLLGFPRTRPGWPYLMGALHAHEVVQAAFAYAVSALPPARHGPSAPRRRPSSTCGSSRRRVRRRAHHHREEGWYLYRRRVPRSHSPGRAVLVRSGHRPSPRGAGLS